jgi:hypothetical protein
VNWFTVGWPEFVRGNRKRIPGFGVENAWESKTTSCLPLRWWQTEETGWRRRSVHGFDIVLVLLYMNV